jgi:small conductance mechanosensitive channel
MLLNILFPHINYAPLFASAGIVGVAIGFGSQALVKDFLSGLFIISENQYRVGDIIDINGNSGTVERIGTRSTVIRDADGNVHYFPNGSIQHVINKTMGYSMARFTIGVHPSNELEKIITLINETGKKLAEEEKWKSKIIDAPSFESIGEFTPSTVNLLISGKTQPSDQWSVTAEMRRRLLVAFEKNKIDL